LQKVVVPGGKKVNKNVPRNYEVGPHRVIVGFGGKEPMA